MKSIFEQSGGTYTKVGDYYIPDLAVPENNYEIRKHGRLRKKYLKEYRPCKYNYLMMSGKLFEHLHEVDVKAQKILDKFISDAEKNAPIRQRTKWNGSNTIFALQRKVTTSEKTTTEVNFYISSLILPGEKFLDSGLSPLS